MHPMSESPEWHLISFLKVIGLYDNVECKLAMCVLYTIAKHECKHPHSVNRIEILLKTRPYVIPPSSFVVEHTIESCL